MPTEITIDVVSDVVCPWCYIGKRRLEAALGGRSDLAATVRWHPFQLDGTIPRGGKPRRDYLLAKFGSEARVADLFGRVREAGLDAGIAFDFDAITVSPNTLDAHRVIAWAGATASAQDAVVERLFRLYFLEGANLADPAVLAEAGVAGGLDAAETRARLAGEDDRAAVAASVERAREIGVTGVPFFIFAGKLGLSGAHGAETMLRAIDQALAA
jgi:predicted DsbA family dithiol-disulfide isomerase